MMPRPYGVMRRPKSASMPQPSRAMTTAANSADQKFTTPNPGTRKPTNINTSAETTNLTMVPMMFIPLLLSALLYVSLPRLFGDMWYNVWDFWRRGFAS